MTNDGTPADAPALAFSEPLIVPAPEGVDRAISEVMGRHEDEFNAALEPFGVELGELMQATWMRFVRIGDVQALYGGQVHSSVLASAPVITPEQHAAFEGAIKRDLVGAIDEPPLRGDLEGSVPTRNLLPLGRQDDCSSGEACGAQCSAVTEPRDYCSAYREADGVSCLFREGHTGAHDFSRFRPSREARALRDEVHPEPRQDAAVFGAPGEAMSNQTPEADRG